MMSHDVHSLVLAVCMPHLGSPLLLRLCDVMICNDILLPHKETHHLPASQYYIIQFPYNYDIISSCTCTVLPPKRNKWVSFQTRFFFSCLTNTILLYWTHWALLVHTTKQWKLNGRHMSLATPMALIFSLSPTEQTLLQDLGFTRHVLTGSQTSTVFCK